MSASWGLLNQSAISVLYWLSCCVFTINSRFAHPFALQSLSQCYFIITSQVMFTLIEVGQQTILWVWFSFSSVLAHHFIVTSGDLRAPQSGRGPYALLTVGVEHVVLGCATVCLCEAEVSVQSSGKPMVFRCPKMFFQLDKCCVSFCFSWHLS